MDFGQDAVSPGPRRLEPKPVDERRTRRRPDLILSASFTLRELSSDRVLLKGRISSVNSFNILTNQFVTTFSESDARERALRELSENIRVRLGIYFSVNRNSAS